MASSTATNKEIFQEKRLGHDFGSFSFAGTVVRGSVVVDSVLSRFFFVLQSE